MAEGALKLGLSLNSSDIQKGLQELSPGISFDAVVNRPSEYRFVLRGGDNMTSTRGGIFYNGFFVGAMDRGIIPELSVWSMKDGYEEIRMCDIERYDDSRVVFVQIMETDKFYHQALLKAEKGDDNFRLDGDGKVFKYQALRETRVRDKVITMGWRSTLVNLASRGIPGVTLDSLNKKFRVRL